MLRCLLALLACLTLTALPAAGASFSDVAPGSWYEGAVAQLTREGALTGYPDGSFRPQGTLTRAETCTLFQNAGGKALDPSQTALSQTVPEPVEARRGGASENGWLQVKGTRLCNEAGSPIALRSMSSHGLQWYGQFASSRAIAATADCGANLLEGENLMYTLHFYAGTHGADLRQRIDSALAQGLPVFVSEWGTSRADGPWSRSDLTESGRFVFSRFQQ